MLLKKTHFSLLLLVSAILFGCAEAPEPDKITHDFELEAPVEDAQLSEVTDELLLSVEYTSLIASSDVVIELNGVEIYPTSPALTIPLVSGATRVQGQLLEYNTVLQTGNNYVQATDTASGYTEGFSFFLDDIPPRVQVTSVTPSLIPGSVIISGEVVDVTSVSSLLFSYPGAPGPVAAAVSGTAPDQTFTVTLPYPDRADPDYTPGNPLEPNDTFDPDVHWVTTRADYAYEIVDSSGQKTYSQIVASESRFVRSAEMFLSYSAFYGLTSILDSALNAVIVDLDTAAFAARDNDPVLRAWPSGNVNAPNLTPGDVINYAALDCRRSIGVYDAGCPSPIDSVSSPSIPTAVADLLVPIDAAGGAGYCSSQIFDPTKVDTCAIYITAVDVNTPYIKLPWDKDRAAPTLEAIVTFPKVVLSFQIIGLQYQAGTGATEIWAAPNYDPNPAVSPTCNNSTTFGCFVPAQASGVEDGTYVYSGALRSKVVLDGFQVAGSFNVALGLETQSNIGQDGKLFTFTRNTPFTTNLRDHLIEQPLISGTSCDVCDLNAGPVNVELIEFFYNIGLIKDGGDSIGKILFDKASEALETETSSLVDTGLQNVEDALSMESFMPTELVSSRDPAITRSLRFDISATRATNHNYLEDWLPDALEPYSIGARFGFDGQVTTDNVNSPVVPIGSDFVKQNGFSDWMFYDKIFHDKQPVQFAFALSANLINQYLASAHATGLFDEFDLAFDGSHFTGTDLSNASAGNAFNLRMTTTGAPSMELIEYQPEQNYGGCFEFQGLGNCGDPYLNTWQPERPQQVAIKLPGLELTVEDVNNPGSPVDMVVVTADVTLHAYVRNGGLEPMPEFATVYVTDVTTYAATAPVDPNFLHARVAATLTAGLNSIGSNAGSLLELGSVRLVDARSVFGDLLGQIDCAGPSKTTPNFLANTMPFRMGVSFKVLDVDAGGDYLTMAGNFTPQAVADCNNAALQSGEVMAFCMQEQPLATYCP